MHTVRNRHASKTRAEAVRSKRGAKRRDAAQPPSQAPHFPADLIIPPHRGSVITSAMWPDATGAPAAAMGRKAMRNAERRAAALARVAAAPTVEELIILPVVAEPVVVPVPAEVLTALQPLPAGRALVARRQGFVDVIAFALRDSGRRLARWSSARRRADDMKDKLARAEARMRAMEAQLVALQALQDRVRQAG